MNRRARVATATSLLVLLIALLALPSCTEGDLTTTTVPSSTTASSDGTSGGGTESTAGGSTESTAPDQTTTDTSDPGTEQPVSWGPVPLVAGWLKDLTVNNGVGVGFIARDSTGHATTEHTYVYALDVSDGSLIGTADIPGGCRAVDIGTRYAFVWADQGIYIYDLTQDFAYVQTWDSHFVSDFGRYFYVEDPTGPDYLIDQETLTPITQQAAFQSDRVSDKSIYCLLYPDCVIGDPYVFEDAGGSDRLPVYSLAENRVIGHVPVGLRSDVDAWDPQRLLAFGVANYGVASLEDKLFAYSLAEEVMVSQSEVTNDEGYAISLREAGTEAYYGHGDRLTYVIADMIPTASGSYVINGRDGWYALSASGEIQYFKSGVKAVAEYEGDVLAYSVVDDSLERDTQAGAVSWVNELPHPFGPHPYGPYLTRESIAWTTSCGGRRGRGDVLTQWGYDGSTQNSTEFPGYEVEILSGDPFVVALRANEPGDDAEWVLAGGDVSQLPMNVVADVDITYAPHEIRARSTEVTFTCEAQNLPEGVRADVTYEWDVDGTTASGAEIVHTFETAGTYTVTVSVRVGDSASVATESVEVTVRDPLVPDGFAPTVYADYYTATGLTYQFQCSGLDWDVAKVSWDFGDGTTGTGLSCSHDYEFGSHFPTCRLYDAAGTLLYEKAVEVFAGYPFFDAYVTPRNGYVPLTVNGRCAPLEGFTDDGLRCSWKIYSTGHNPVQISGSASFTRLLRETGTYYVDLEITDPANVLAYEQTFTIEASNITLTVTDEGRTIRSDVPMWAEVRGDPEDDPDKDGLYQRWEDVVMQQVNPRFELDEGEDLLEHRDTDKVVNFVRVSTWPDDATPQTAEYIIMYYAVCWTKDYGRYSERIKLTQGHTGDIEKVTILFDISDEYTLDMAWVYTSAHSSNHHYGVWESRGESTNEAVITGFGTEEMTASLEFSENALKLYASEDKHAIYPSLQVGESVRLLYLGYLYGFVGGLTWPFLLESALVGAVDKNEFSTGFVQEDVGGGPVERFPCYNAGEPCEPTEKPTTRLMDDIGRLFKNERIWSGNVYDPSSFAGGLTPEKAGPFDAWPGSPGTIGGDGLSVSKGLEEWGLK